WSGPTKSCSSATDGASWTNPSTRSSAHWRANDVSLAPSATANRRASGFTAYASSYSLAAFPDFGAHHAVADVCMGDQRRLAGRVPMSRNRISSTRSALNANPFDFSETLNPSRAALSRIASGSWLDMLKGTWANGPGGPPPGPPNGL